MYNYVPLDFIVVSFPSACRGWFSRMCDAEEAYTGTAGQPHLGNLQGVEKRADHLLHPF